MQKTTYEIMHKDTVTAQIDTQGCAHIFFPDRMPYGLYLEEPESRQDIDTLVNNALNFNYWCASRVLTLDRAYAKAILGSIGMKQAVTDKDRAQIALSCRCASLTDVFWVRYAGEQVCFRDVNLYENHLDRTFIDIALKGRQYTVQNKYLARDLATNGIFPKAWKRTADGFVLLKDGGRCQTLFWDAAFEETMTQKEAAIAAVRKIGLHQTAEVQKEIFAELPQYYEMFTRRLELLKEVDELADPHRQEEKQQ